MLRRALSALVAATLLVPGACYQDDTPTGGNGKPVARVLLTDAPFPYDSLSSVTIYVVRIEASNAQDTSGSGPWVLITEPRKAFDLLALQQGTTALLGAGEMPSGQYHAVRMTIDTSQSSIRWNDTALQQANVNWHGWSAIYAVVEYPVNVAAQGADIVLDLDVGRSFPFNFYGNYEFDFTPQLRAINSAAAGAIAGTVTQGSGGATSPVPNAQVSVFAPSPGQPDSIGYLEATGRSDQAGHYKVGFLPPNRYFVKIEQPFFPSLEAVVTANVQVTAGGTTPLSVSLPQAGGGHAYLHISGPTQVGVGGIISLFTAVGDSNGNPVYNAPVTWRSSDTLVAAVGAPNDTVTAWVTGRQVGVATIYASTGGLTDSLAVHVVSVGSVGVATVTIVPDSATVTLGDTGVFLQAVFRDSAGNVMDGYASWFSSDSSVVSVWPCASCVRDRALGRAPGTATVFATSQGKTGQATITVLAQVTGSHGSVASVEVQPASANLAVGDTIAFGTILRDSAGNILTGRPVSWFSTDSAFAIVNNFGPSIIGRGQRVGSAVLQATSQGKTGQASITVH
ncbi:MAG TPA: DUF4382 domain-containing protein [Gemmatimonadales bacterium]|nr:DUF4382 domain-containing protein [Gemmatimonadales bacterium]